MDYTYGDILSAHRPVHDEDVFSRRHPKMARLNRAKLFAPFAALSGFDDAVRSKEVPYVPRHILDADETYEMNAVLNALYRRLAQANWRVGTAFSFAWNTLQSAPMSTMTHLDGLGCTTRLRGSSRGVDSVRQLLLVGGRAISFADIDDITDTEGRPLMFRRY